jgi:hypothetical protein
VRIGAPSVAKTEWRVMNSDDKRFDWITEKIIGCAFKVGSKLGCGFLENLLRECAGL